MIKHVIVQPCYQIHPQHKSPASVSISFRHYSKYLQMSNNMFYYYTLLCQFSICRFLLNCQFTPFRLFHRCCAVFMQTSNALIARICKTKCFLQKLYFTLFVKRKIVSCSFAKSCVENSFACSANSHLCFYRVPLFLARVEATLFFFGRSIADSTTSTTTTSTSEGSFSPRLTGNCNSGAALKMSSTRVMTRETVDSLKPHDLAMWNCVLYSRQYSRVKRTWFSIESLGVRPEMSRRLAVLSRTISQILSKVDLLTPEYRLKSESESSVRLS